MHKIRLGAIGLNRTSVFLVREASRVKDSCELRLEYRWIQIKSLPFTDNTVRGLPTAQVKGPDFALTD